MPIRNAAPSDLPEIVAIYNASVPGRMATADLAPVTISDRQAWFDESDPARRPLWVFCDAASATPLAWLALRSFYGRPAYDATVEVSVYTSPSSRRQGHARQLLDHAIQHAPALEVTTFVAFTFAHNTPSIRLFGNAGFAEWGLLPRIARLDGVTRDLAILGRHL